MAMLLSDCTLTIFNTGRCFISTLKCMCTPRMFVLSRLWDYVNVHAFILAGLICLVVIVL